MATCTDFEELDAAVDTAVLDYSEANKALYQHYAELPVSDDYALTPTHFRLSKTLLNLVFVCDERAKADEHLNLHPTDPYAWASIARDGIKRAQRSDPSLLPNYRARLFSENQEVKKQQFWLYLGARICFQNPVFDASQEKP